MMKHESLSKTRLPAGAAVDCSTKQASKRGGLWRVRSLSEAPSTTPRSPITKAFDFLPWSRGKRSAEPKAKSPSPPAPQKGAATQGVTASTNAAESSKDAALHYHRNIFRSGGGLIRDILSERSHKEKINTNGNQNINNTNNNKNSSSNNNKSQRKFKQLASRNKSLDINELIDNVGNDLLDDAAVPHDGGTLKRGGSRQRFLDDTFIENMAREQERNSGWYNESDDEVDGADVDVDVDVDVDGVDDSKLTTNHYDPETGFYQKSPSTAADAPLRSSFHTMHGGSNASKHILFNDENMVYLIKKEQPVKRREGGKVIDSAKSAKKLNSSHSNVSSPRGSFRSGNNSNNNNEQSSILRARLKFKKLSPHGDSCQENEAMHAASLSRSRNYEAVARSSNNIVNDFAGGSRRGILQRQNTSPALVEAGAGSLLPSPTLGRNQGGSIRRRPHNGEQTKHRRKSLTEMLSYEKQQQLHAYPHHQQQTTHPQQQQQQQNSQYYNHSSSSSSMGSGSQNSAGAALTTTERPRAEKPRKKLSFREPVVTEKERMRRLSSPLQRSPLDVDLELRDLGLENPHARSGRSSLAESTNKRLTLQNQNSLDVVVCADQESQAMRIVRTVGQAFEVCHKFNFHKNSVDHNNDERSDVSSELLDVERISEQPVSDEETSNKKDQLTTSVDLNHVHPPQRPNHLDLITRVSPSASQADDDKSQATPTSPSHEIVKLKDQLEQQALQTRQALAQLMLVREQLISETNARIEAQARTQQLLQQNRELLEHLASLGAYNEQQTAGLTSANIAMAPQSQLQMLLQATSNNNNLATINQQISNLGSINQQLTSLSHQLSGLNQQSQNLQNFQNIQNLTNTNVQQQQSPQPQQQQQQQQQSPLTSLLATPSSTAALTSHSTSPYPSMSQLQTISNQLQQMNAQSTQQQLQQDTLSKDLMQVNQELLNRLQSLNLSGGGVAGASPTAATTLQAVTTPHNSFFYVNPMSCSPQPGNNNNNNNNGPSNFNFLSSGGGANGNNIAGNLTPSPMSTLNRNSYTHSPIADFETLRLSIDKNLNRVDELTLLSKLPSVASNGNLAGMTSTATTTETSRSTSTIDSQSSPRSRSANETPLLFNTVTLKVTDEAGNVTNQRKLSATPSFITRSTSEKVPNRSQMMSEVQRTTWARHTTK